MAHKKGQNKKKDEKKQYVFITSGEMEHRLHMHQHHLQDLRDILNQVDEAYGKYDKYLKSKLEQEEWDFFIACNGLPKSHIIPDIRLFVEKIHYFEQKRVMSSMDWLLPVNERSILTQDIFEKNCTKPRLKQEIAPQFGQEYSHDIALILELIGNMTGFLVNDFLTKDLSDNALVDIIEEKHSLYGEIRNIFDRYSYRVLCSENANCENIDAITAEYTYDDKNFQIHIWMLKNVPIHFNDLEILNMKANLHQLNVSVTLPNHILKNNLVLRGIHYEFDHFSELAKSFSRSISVPFENMSSLIPNIHACLESELHLYLKVQDEIRTQMIAKRKEFEEKLQAFEEAEAESGKRNKNQQNDNEKKGKKVKSTRPVEVPALTDNLFPEVTDDFLNREQQLYTEFIEAAYNPEHLRLTEDEINLKQYFLLGGIYELYFISKLEHLDFDNVQFNMTWHENKGSVLIDKDFIISQDEMPVLERKSARSKSFFSNEQHHFREEPNYEENKYFEMKFILPEYLCEWEVPLVCQYEDNVETLEDEKEENLIESLSVINARQPSMARLTTALPVDMADDMNLFKSSLSRSHASIDNSTSHKIRDFSLNEELTVQEVRQLERYVLPYMLSSYKFADEIANEAKNINQDGKKETASRKILGKKQKEEEVVTSHIFNHKNQYNPERLFPRFDKSEKLHVRMLENDMDVEEPNTFFDLVAMFKILKAYFANSYRKVLRVPAIQVKSKRHSPKKSIEIVAKVAPSTAVRRATRSPKPKMSNSKSKSSIISSYEIQSPENEPKHIKTYSHWTTKYIQNSTFDRGNRTMTVYTDRLGIFGFAINRYIHFPFKDWIMQASDEKPYKEVILTIETQYVKVVLKITAEGYTGFVTQPSKVFIRNPKMYLVIDEPVSDMRILKDLFREKNVNIFVDQDAGFYVNKGYFSQKHMANEFHVYDCMAVHSALMRFELSIWNRIAPRRDILLNFVHNKEPVENNILVRVTPEKATFDDVRELCSDNLDVIKLEYTPTWRNLENCADLNFAIISVYASVANEGRVKDFKLICNIKNLLANIRLLSFS